MGLPLTPNFIVLLTVAQGKYFFKGKKKYLGKVTGIYNCILFSKLHSDILGLDKLEKRTQKQTKSLRRGISVSEIENREVYYGLLFELLFYSGFDKRVF